MNARRLMSDIARLPEVSHELTYSIGGLARLVEAEGPTNSGPGYATFRVRRTTDASSLARAITGSRAAGTRVMAHRQLSRLDGAPFPTNGRAIAGEMIELELRAGQSAESPATEFAQLLYHDTFFVAAEKPGGILVHSDGTGGETLAGRVLATLRAEGSTAVPQALNRLDVGTTGIVLFSTVAETQPAFDALIAEGRLTKRYYALIQGELPEGAMRGWYTIDAPLARDRHDARKMRVGSSGKPARSRLRVLEQVGGRTLVEVEIASGRRHQIRVHLSHLGCPIVGDLLYGGAPADGRLYLHAHEVELTHPLTGKRIVIESPRPW